MVKLLLKSNKYRNGNSCENGNLIVPVIKNADHLNLKDLFAVNDLSKEQDHSLKPEEISDGTYTVTMLVILDQLWELQLLTNHKLE